MPQRTEMPQKYTRRKYVRDLKQNPKWQAVLQEYAKLHRTCRRRIGDLTVYFSSRNTSVNCKFVVVDIVDRVGLGNRLLVTASAFLYALMTQQVFLIIGTNVLVPDILCEPFEGSSWLNFNPPRADQIQNWNKSQPIHSRIDEARKLQNASAALSLVMD